MTVKNVCWLNWPAWDPPCMNLVPSFEYYLREVRPKFSEADRHNGVWASTKGGPLTANAIARVITECGFRGKVARESAMMSPIIPI
jgi:hypothetical protein